MEIGFEKNKDVFKHAKSGGGFTPYILKERGKTTHDW